MWTDKKNKTFFMSIGPAYLEFDKVYCVFYFTLHSTLEVQHMGKNMLVLVERAVDGRYEQLEELRPFSDRDYTLFGFFADVRNEDNVSPISQPRGIPRDSFIYGKIEEGEADLGDWSWLSVSELLAFDYDATFKVGPAEYRDGGIMPIYRPVEGSGHGTRTFREALGKSYFADLDLLASAGAARILIAFYP